MNVIPVIIYAAELALAAIILFYVVERWPLSATICRLRKGSRCEDR